MLIGAIDPGVASGAYAIVDDERGVLVVDDLPTHQAQHGRTAKPRPELDLHGLKLELTVYQVEHVFIERVAARPGQGVVSMFRFGYASGAIYGLLVGLGLPVTFVLPQEWQKFHRIGPSSDAGRQRAVQIYPSLAAHLTRKRHGNRADAVLIGAFGLHQRRQHPASLEHADRLDEIAGV